VKVLAIDPGSEQSAYVLYDCESREVIEHRKAPNHEVMDRIYLKPSAGFDELPDKCVIEMVASYGMAVGREVFETCVWIGRYFEAWRIMTESESPSLMVRRDVKMHLCARNNAKDPNIRQALIDKFGPGKDRAIGRKANPGPLYGISGDCWAALAVAVTFAETHNGHDQSMYGQVVGPLKEGK
jgi:hypothetical protein